MKNIILLSGLICLVAVSAGPSWGDSLDDAWVRAGAMKASAASRIRASDVGGDDPWAVKPGVPVEWVSIDGGKFMMGTDDSCDLFTDATPRHEVDIKTFEISKTLVTVEQYKECVIKGGCTIPTTGGYCNWAVEGLQRHPINCVDWNQANQYARFKEARLPSESEYEYAATSGGKSQKYPWGNEDATCDKAVMDGCGKGTMRVCSKPAGNAKVSGGELCDMSGNVAEWVQDKWQNSYAGAPTNGSAFEGGAGPGRVIRGGGWDDDAGHLRSACRDVGIPGFRWLGLGFRLARSIR